MLISLKKFFLINNTVFIKIKEKKTYILKENICFFQLKKIVVITYFSIYHPPYYRHNI